MHDVIELYLVLSYTYYLLNTNVLNYVRMTEFVTFCTQQKGITLGKMTQRFIYNTHVNMNCTHFTIITPSMFICDIYN